MPDDAAVEFDFQRACSVLKELQNDLDRSDVKKQWKNQAANWQRSVTKIAGQGAPLS